MVVYIFLEKLTDTIAEPNADVKAHAPKMVTTTYSK